MAAAGAGGLSEALARVHEVGPLVAGCAEASERHGRLTEDVVEALHSTGLLRVLIPDDAGGLGLTLPESIEVFRAMAAYDASTGWALTILGDGPLFGRFLERSVFDELFAHPRAALAGSLNPLTGRADAVAGGYRFSGTATYASGCHHATWLMAGAWVHRDGQPAFADGAPELIAGVMPITDATIHDTWSVSGMRATGSNDCSYSDVIVPDERTFRWPDPTPRIEPEIFGKIPLMVQVGTGLASAIVGAARGAQTWFLDLAAAKTPTGSFSVLSERAHAQMAVGEAEGLVLAAEDTLSAAVHDVWARGASECGFDDAARVQMRMRTVTAARLAIKAVDLLHDAAGMNGVLTSSPLERAWRDVHTASQHVVLNVGRIEVAGRVLLGLDPGSPII